MKKSLAALLSTTVILSLCACGSNGSGASAAASKSGSSAASASVSSQAAAASSAASASAVSPAGTAEAVTDTSVTADETTAAFSLASEDGTFSETNGVYTITSAGTFVLTGRLDGQIVVDAGDASEVILELKETTISYDQDSPIKILSADKVEISAKSGTDNVINDNRPEKTADDETQGEGAIFAKADLKMKGTGTLVVNAGYSNGIYTTKDLKIQKLSLKSTAVNCALRGDDSITMESGTVVAISSKGDGLKTDSTEVNKNGQTRGDLEILGGALTVYAAGDGFQAAHNFMMATGEEGTAPAVTIFTGSYSGYTAADADTASCKGIKTQNELNISSGSLTISSYDDGLHADYGEDFDDGTSGTGTINISGGTVTMGVYASDTATAGGRMGPESFGSQKTAVGADAIHSDNILNISGGTIHIDSAHEGLEANVINISGGETIVLANDDCVNATKGSATPLINITGGYLETSVPANGDVDGIDSNGLYTQSGGVVIARGPSGEMAAAIDADGSVTVSGGTLIILGGGKVTAGEGVSSYNNMKLHEAGEHTVSIGGTSYTFTNAEGYAATACYSDTAVEG